MDAIVLEPSLRMTLEQDAAHEARSVNDLINEAVAHYLRERQQAKIDREIAAYEARKHARGIEIGHGGSREPSGA